MTADNLELYIHCTRLRVRSRRCWKVYFDAGTSALYFYPVI